MSAPPVLTPASTVSISALPATGTLASVSSTLPYGIYASSSAFISGAADMVAYAYQMLGGNVLNLEVTETNVYAAYEEATLEYSYIVNLHQARNALGSYLGQPTGTFNEDGELVTGDDASLAYPSYIFSYGRRVGYAIENEIGLGGTRREYSASFQLTKSVQDYDLQSIISSNPALTGVIGDKRIIVREIFYRSPHATWRFYGYFGGLNVIGNLHTYGQYADDSTFEVIPAWQNKLQAMAYEDSIYTRVSHYSYEIKGNRLKIYPVPTEHTYISTMWLRFVVENQDAPWSEAVDENGQVIGDSGVHGVNNLNTVPFGNIPYENINSIGKHWIRRYALALVKRTLGMIRQKFAQIPIPNEGVSLNGDALVRDAEAEITKLKEELRNILDDLTYDKVVTRDGEILEAARKIQENIPLPIYQG